MQLAVQAIGADRAAGMSFAVIVQIGIEIDILPVVLVPHPDPGRRQQLELVAQLARGTRKIGGQSHRFRIPRRHFDDAAVVFPQPLFFPVPFRQHQPLADHRIVGFAARQIEIEFQTQAAGLLFP